MTQLTKKGEFQWNKEAQKSFESLRLAITSSLVLSLLNFSQPFELECDALGKGLGVVLMQQGKLIAFFSKALSDTQLSKSIYEKELMAVGLAIQHWRHYLMAKNSLFILTKEV